MQGDVTVLKSDIQRLLEQLADARAEAVASVAALAQIDLVKTRMEAAYDTLKVSFQRDLASEYCCLT